MAKKTKSKLGTILLLIITAIIVSAVLLAVFTDISIFSTIQQSFSADALEPVFIDNGVEPIKHFIT